MQSAFLARILLFPIKSLDPVAVPSATITEGGTLRHDREWAMFDSDGRVVNGKREARLHLVRAVYDAEISRVSLSAPGMPEAVLLLSDAPAVAEWLGAFLGQKVELRRDTATGFPDDLEASGPTLVSQASLREAAAWFPARPEEPDAPGLGFGIEEARLRFRTNLEICGAPPAGAGAGTGAATAAGKGAEESGAELPAFWEDQLFAGAGEDVAFRIGAVAFRGRNPCQRCAVPGRDSRTGEATARFSRIFSDRRKATLPPWVNPQRFNHFYRFAVNTAAQPGQAGAVLRCGDAVVVE